MDSNINALYAEDVLLFRAENITTIPHFKNLILTYGYFSGYKVWI